MIKITDKHTCCGCEACVQACPKHCISLRQDAEGFSYPDVDEQACSGCGVCERTCPMLSPYESRTPERVLAAVNPDDEIREQSSSGGIFTMLAEGIINRGGVVFGVRFDEHWQPVFDHTDNVEGLAAFRGSKYVQARVGNAFVETKEFLKAGREVMFSGTPCQVAALRHFLRHDYEHLLCVDFICHGVPSPKVWGRYLDEVTQNAVHAISDVQFRNKREGWKRFNFDLTYDREGQRYRISTWHQQNHFMRVFLNEVILRPSCHDCKARGGRSGSDLTIADFWGIGKLNPQMDDDKGTSLVLVHSEKGAQHFAACHTSLWETHYEDILCLNPAIERSPIEHPKRAQFFARLDQTESLIALADDILCPPFSVRLKKLGKRGLRRMYKVIKNIMGG